MKADLVAGHTESWIKNERMIAKGRPENRKYLRALHQTLNRAGLEKPKDLKILIDLYIQQIEKHDFEGDEYFLGGLFSLHYVNGIENQFNENLSQLSAPAWSRFEKMFKIHSDKALRSVYENDLPGRLKMRFAQDQLGRLPANQREIPQKLYRLHRIKSKDRSISMRFG